MKHVSELQKARATYRPKLPSVFANGPNVKIVEGEPTNSVANSDEIKPLFPNTYGLPIIRFEKSDEPVKYQAMTIGVILSGGQAPGGHNVIAGVYDSLKAGNPDSVLLGFKGGPSGLIENDFIKLDDKLIDAHRNTGGFDLIGSGRTKLETEDQFEIVLKNCKKNNVNALVIIGGDDSNTNAGVLAEYFSSKKSG